MIFSDATAPVVSGLTLSCSRDRALTHPGPPLVGPTGFRGAGDGWRLALERFAAVARTPSRPTLS